jgi:hypothetical protein
MAILVGRTRNLHDFGLFQNNHAVFFPEAELVLAQSGEKDGKRVYKAAFYVRLAANAPTKST